MLFYSRTNQALTIITKWTPKLVSRIRVLAEMDAHRLPIDTQNARIIASGWIDALSRIKAKKLRLEVYKR
jgi:hypothetical protein